MSTATMPSFITADWLGDKVYPATIVGAWNGWAVPLVDADTARRIVTDMAALRAEGDTDSDTLTWDGDTIVRHQPAYADEAGYTDERLAPNTDGMYAIGFDWCWSACDAEGGWV